jgi:hypothetical protein
MQPEPEKPIHTSWRKVFRFWRKYLHGTMMKSRYDELMIAFSASESKNLLAAARAMLQNRLKG